MKKPLTLHPPGADYEIRILGNRPQPLRDFYHALLRMNWPSTLSVITAGFLLMNGLFALAYEAIGGIENAATGSFEDAFFFSVQTMGTIGYGAMYPHSRAANWLVVVESIVGLIMTALTTGLMFAKFSRPTARILFSHKAVIGTFNGQPTLMLRLGNERGNAIVDCQFRVVVTRTERTREDGVFYRSYDLALQRDRALSLNRSFSISHRIDEASPFFGQNAQSLVAQEYEMQIIVVGIDDTVMQTVHARRVYYASDIAWGSRLANVLSETLDGTVVLDLGKFHDVEAEH